MLSKSIISKKDKYNDNIWLKYDDRKIEPKKTLIANCAPPKISVKFKIDKPVMDYSKSVEDITHIVNGDDSHLYTVGLTRYYARPSFIVNMMKSGEYVSGTIDANVDIKNITVFIAKEFKNTNCEKDFIYSHEMRHVQSYETLLLKVSQELEAELHKSFNSCYDQDRDKIQSDLSWHLNSKWANHVKELISESRELDRLIDSPEEYARLKSACGGKILNGFKKF